MVFSQKTERLNLKKYLVAKLSDSLNESSALNIFNGDLFSLNDSGNSAELFKINPKNGKLEKIIPTGLINKDWEALTNDGQSFYIGDIGNNPGTRKDLTIFKVPYFNGKAIQDSIQKINFEYEDQKEFITKYQNNNFDAESLIYLNGKLHVFSKEWASQNVSNYVIDSNVSTLQQAQKLETFHTGYVVTDASYYDGKLYIVGYTKKTSVFMSVFEETAPGIFFKGKHKKYKLGTTIKAGQIEGIAVNADGVYISVEAFKIPMKTTPQKLYFIPMKRITL